MNRIIVTGSNGAGKTHFSAELARLRPDLRLISYDALKLTVGWQRRCHEDVKKALTIALAGDCWIIEGGPSLLRGAISRADALIWLDPSRSVQALRLLLRPWRNLGQTRTGLPKGNVDWPLQQYQFALRSLMRRSKTDQEIEAVFQQAQTLNKWRLRNEADCTRCLESFSDKAIPPAQVP